MHMMSGANKSKDTKCIRQQKVKSHKKQQQTVWINYLYDCAYFDLPARLAVRLRYLKN